MDDASRTSTLLERPVVSHSEAGAAQAPLPPDTLQDDFLEPRLVVRYTHTNAPTQIENVYPAAAAEIIDCKSFEELLLHLENDLVEAIVFDGSVSVHECKYIMGWARIFKPSVRCQRVLPAEHLSKGRRSSEVA